MAAKTKFNKIFLSLSAAIFSCFFIISFLTACSRPVDLSYSDEELKKGLIALDSGNEVEAEMALQRSLNANPANAKARTSLASIYASRAGLSLKDWLDPLIRAGQDVGKKEQSFRRSSDFFENLKQAVDRGTGVESKKPASDDEEMVKKRIAGLALSVGKVSLGMIITIDLFQDIPYLNESKVASLDRAIQILREENLQPESRTEEVRIYLSILSVVRLIHFSRELVGSFDHETERLFTSNSQLCKADAGELKIKIYAIKDSLSFLEEGLRPRPGEEANKMRNARAKFHAFLSKFLLVKEWDEIDKFYEKGSDQNQDLMKVMRRFCGVENIAPQAGPGPQPGGFGANLFDPDEE